MKLKEKIEEIGKTTFIKIVGLGWNISVRNPDKKFKNTFKDVLEKDIKTVKIYKESGMVVIDI